MLKQKQENMINENKGRSRRLKFARKFMSETTSKNVSFLKEMGVLRERWMGFYRPHPSLTSRKGLF